MTRHETNLFAFLIGNMKDMEIELRAHSIVFEALSSKVIGPDQMGDALTFARDSTEMLHLVREKYRLLAENESGQTHFADDESPLKPNSVLQ